MAITEKLKDIANAIRNKTGTSELMRLDEMDDLILEIKLGTLSDKDITDCKISGNTVIIPPGNYSRGIQIAFQNWDWDPFDFESSFITDASGVTSMDEI